MEMKVLPLLLAAALNPLVVRTPEPHMNVPAHCEVSDAPAAPRPVAAERAQQDEPAVRPPVRATTTGTAAAPRYDLGALQNALARNDRATFDAELARARAAGAPVRVYEDVARLWDAQFESPFFAAGSDPHRIASQYPGYEAAVREQVFTDPSGNRFYPAAESRAFVARQTGVKLPETGARPVTRSQRPPQMLPPGPAATQQHVSTSRPASGRSSSSSTNRRPPASGGSSSARSRPSPDPSSTRPPAPGAPAPAVPVTGVTSPVTAPSGAGSSPADVPPDPAVSTETQTTATVATEATSPAATTAPAADTATTTSTADTETKSSRPILLPLILILIGLGVLILLFKAR